MTMAKKGKEKSVTEVIPKPASDVIKEIEDTFLNHRVLVYTAGRSIGFWDIPPMFRILEKLGKQKQLSIILQNRGGYMDDAFKMANVIHEFAEEVTFIIPSYANSAATLLCLSGNKLLMGTISELGPTNPMMSVDERLITPTILEPSTVPGESKEQSRPKQRQMATHALKDFLIAAGVLRQDDKGEIAYEPQALSVYMANGILNPFLLGDFERSGKIAVQYAETLLSRYMFRDKESKDVLSNSTAKRLCEGYYDHSYPIGRKEARDVLNLTVEDISDELWHKTSELLSAYDQMMEQQNIATIIETSDAFEIDYWPK